jgi:hypothetical protein
MSGSVGSPRRPAQGQAGADEESSADEDPREIQACERERPGMGARRERWGRLLAEVSSCRRCRAVTGDDGIPCNPCRREQREGYSDDD